MPSAKPTKDFSVALTEEIHAALEARSCATGKSMQDIARKVLSEWAEAEHHAYTVYARRLLSNGMQLELDVVSPEADLKRREGRR